MVAGSGTRGRSPERDELGHRLHDMRQGICRDAYPRQPGYSAEVPAGSTASPVLYLDVVSGRRCTRVLRTSKAHLWSSACRLCANRLKRHSMHSAGAGSHSVTCPKTVSLPAHAPIWAGNLISVLSWHMFIVIQSIRQPKKGIHRRQSLRVVLPFGSYYGFPNWCMLCSEC